MIKNIGDVLMKSQIFPVMEFVIIFSLIMMTYRSLHKNKGLRFIRPVVKMSVSMLIVTLCYIIGKVSVIGLLASNVTPSSAYAF